MNALKCKNPQRIPITRGKYYNAHAHFTQEKGQLHVQCHVLLGQTDAPEVRCDLTDTDPVSPLVHAHQGLTTVTLMHMHAEGQ